MFLLSVGGIGFSQANHYYKGLTLFAHDGLPTLCPLLASCRPGAALKGKSARYTCVSII